jgi:protein SCO1
MKRLRAVRIALWILVIIAGIGAGVLSSGIFSPREVAQTGTSVADIGGPFRLTTHKGKNLTDADLRGCGFLLFFGFTYCPDVCPTTLTELTWLFEDLGADANKLTAFLVTVDPERDTQEVLAQYMELFDPRFIALRGTVAETEAIAKAYNAYFQKVPLNGGNYTMDHQSIIYMMDRNGRFAGSLDRHESKEVQLTKLRRLLDR